jgi:hypothetical protein
MSAILQRATIRQRDGHVVGFVPQTKVQPLAKIIAQVCRKRAIWIGGQGTEP